MKINQQMLQYMPITIKLEKHSEAKAFFSLIDKLGRFYSDEGETFTHEDFTKEQRELIVKLSNAMSDSLYI